MWIFTSKQNPRPKPKKDDKEHYIIFKNGYDEYIVKRVVPYHPHNPLRIPGVYNSLQEARDSIDKLLENQKKRRFIAIERYEIT